MQGTNRQAKIPRGSSPPFQEMEKWIDDGANGSHWVKMPSVGSQKRDNRLLETLGRKSAMLLQSEDEGRWADDGGKNMSAPPYGSDTLILLEQ